MRLLRRMKAEAALLIALADIGGVWPVMRTTQALTELADTAVAAAVRFLLRDAVRARPAQARAIRREPERGSGYIVLAMGKMGAFELNYSSDIDLIVFYDADAPALADKDRASSVSRADHARAGQAIAGADGRRLRVPHRSAAAARPGLDRDRGLDRGRAQLLRSVGQNWERAAMIKARPCAGDIAAGEAILAQLRPSSGANISTSPRSPISQAMKRQIHAYRGHGEIAVEGHNIKLGRGGIREIEFFVQTQQLIAGGRHPELRGRETLPMLAALADGGWIGAEARDDLDGA